MCKNLVLQPQIKCVDTFLFNELLSIFILDILPDENLKRFIAILNKNIETKRHKQIPN